MPTPVRKKVSDIKSQFLNPALTSHFECRFTPPESVVNWIKESSNAGLGLPWTGNEEFFSIACIDASLPGSSLMTHEQNNDFHGITERHAYRRDYGSGSDFTFLVDTNHYLLFFFENWIRYIVNERFSGDNNYPEVEDYTRSYTRVNYPDNYISREGIYINKFERDYESSLGITYKFLNAYPIAIASMPVSYEASQLLKCTVTFTYTKYVAKPLSLGQQSIFNQVSSNLTGTGALATSIPGLNIGGSPISGSLNSRSTIRQSVGQIQNLQEASRLRQAGFNVTAGLGGQTGPGFS